MPKQPLRELNERHERFCQRYVEHLKKRQAAIDAGFSEKSAHATATDLLKDPLIQSRIQDIREEYKEQIGVFDGHVIKTWTRIMMACVSDFGTYEDGEFTLKDWKYIHNDDLHAIKKLDQDTKYNRFGEKTVKLKIEFHDKLEASDKIARHFGMYEKDNAQRNPDMEDPIHSARARVSAELMTMAERVLAARNGEGKHVEVKDEEG